MDYKKLGKFSIMSIKFTLSYLSVFIHKYNRRKIYKRKKAAAATLAIEYVIPLNWLYIQYLLPLCKLWVCFGFCSGSAELWCIDFAQRLGAFIRTSA